MSYNINIIKRNWKNILIVALSLFGLNKCTTSCNRQSKIVKLEKNVSHQDSVIKSKNDTIKDLKRDLEEYINRVGLLDKFEKERNKQDSITNSNNAKITSALNHLTKNNK